MTVSDSSTIAQVITSSGLVPVTTSSKSTSTGTPSLNGSSGSSGSSGLSSSSKKTIIGVVVGIGGAILVGALAVVAWRIWGRNKKGEDEDDIYGNPPGSSDEAKTSSISGQSPFKTTLDQYHNPAPVNTASNF